MGVVAIVNNLLTHKKGPLSLSMDLFYVFKRFLSIQRIKGAMY